ncbi:hypothetical protein FRC06_004153 [Ceratobasidium sp. 370]|nr:hypothetical protein FRC06_004153 [Ceratobasidium sp. 370]
MASGAAAFAGFGLFSSVVGVGDVGERTARRIKSRHMPAAEEIIGQIEKSLANSKKFVSSERKLDVFDSETAKGYVEQLGKYEARLEKERITCQASESSMVRMFCVNAQLKIELDGQKARLTLMLGVVTRFHTTVVSESERRRGLQDRLFQDEADLPTPEGFTPFGAAVTWIRNKLTYLSTTSAEVDVEQAAPPTTLQSPSQPGPSSDIDGAEALSSRSLFILMHTHTYFR